MCIRWWWLWWLCVSCCCGGALCVALWARFLQRPALLAARSPVLAARYRPLVATCLPTRQTSRLLIRNYTTDSNLSRSLTLGITQLLRKKTIANEQLAHLEQFLDFNNETLPRALLSRVPPCAHLALRCRWHNIFFPCKQLFEKKLTPWGVCCVILPEKLKKYAPKISYYPVSTLVIALKCGNGSNLYGCEFFAKYDLDQWKQPLFLTPGFHYEAILSFILIQDNEDTKVVDSTCVSEAQYSRNHCLLKCAESVCGCVDPLQIHTAPGNRNRHLPLCSVTRLNCIRTIHFENTTCNCLPSCQEFISDISMENSKLGLLEYTFDPFYKDLNTSVSVVISVRMAVLDSKVFARLPTETWFTLLSSLGGVFNMFLGVGLFSVVEVMFFLVRLPAALRKQQKNIMDH